MCTIELTALKFKAGESAKTDHKMRRPAHVQTELSEDIATQTSRMTKLPPNVLTGDPPLRYDDGIWDNPQGAFAWDRGAAMTRKSRDGRHQTGRSAPRNRTHRSTVCHHGIQARQNVEIATIRQDKTLIWQSLLFRWVSLRDRCYFNVSAACPLTQKCVMVGLDRHLCQDCVICCVINRSSSIQIVA